jgi:hypothetical protein
MINKLSLICLKKMKKNIILINLQIKEIAIKTRFKVVLFKFWIMEKLLSREYKKIRIKLFLKKELQKKNPICRKIKTKLLKAETISK